VILQNYLPKLKRNFQFVRINVSNLLYILLVKEIKIAQSKRLVTKFNEKEDLILDKEINKISSNILEGIKETEDMIKSLSCFKTSCISQQQIRDNMKTNLINEVQVFTRQLKINQDEYLNKYKNLVGDKVIYNEYETKLTQNSGNTASTGDQSFLQSKVNENQKRKNQEIDCLIGSITELGQIMKDFQMLVFEQGTILDRIDFNIEVALENTKKGHEDLKKANEHHKSNCVRNANIILMVIILVEAILVIFKYTI